MQTSDILSLATGEYKAGGKAQRDVFSYSLSITNVGATFAFVFDDVSVPSSVQRLLRFLKDYALRG